MSISPEAIQAISSRLSAIYVGSSIGSNVVAPVNTYNDNPNPVTARSALIGGATIGFAAR